MAVGMKKGLALIMLANVINLVIGLMNGFVLPKFLSVETYAAIKTFTLYSTYAGIFHLGYLDGMYLKYGGKNMMSISSKEYGNDFWNVAIFQIFVSSVILIISVLFSNFILGAFAVLLFFKNVTTCFQMFFQATGEYKLYSSALNYGTILSFVISMLLIFVFRTDDYVLYISAQVLSTIVVVVYLGVLLNSRIQYFREISITKTGFKENIGSGFVLMIGNFSNNLFTSLDRWFVKILMTSFHFATYSFAVSIDALITVFITPLYVTLYNAFCIDHSPERIIQIKRLVTIWGFLLISFTFPAKWLIESYLDKYDAAIPIIFVLTSTQVFYGVIKGVYVNYFKSQKMQMQYFLQIIAMLIIAILLCLLLYFIFKSMMSLAIAALLTAIIWLCVNEYKHKELRFEFKDWLYVALVLTTYLATGFFVPTILALFIYIIVFLLASLFFMREQSVYILSLLNSRIKKIIFCHE